MEEPGQVAGADVSIKREPIEVIELDDDNEDAVPVDNTPRRGNAVRTERLDKILVTTEGPYVPTLRIGLVVPHFLESPAWHPVSSMAVQDGEAFHTKFTNDYLVDSPKAKRYSYMARHPEKYTKAGLCVNRVIRQGGSGSNPFDKAGGDEQSACDTCIRTGRLCVRVVEKYEGFGLCAYPLPQRYREGSLWVHMGFWINGGGLAYKVSSLCRRVSRISS
jgi:hypothetical protein